MYIINLCMCVFVMWRCHFYYTYVYDMYTYTTTAAAAVVIVIVIIIIFFSLPNRRRRRRRTAGYVIYDGSATLPILFVPVNNSPPPSPITSSPSPLRCVYTLYAIILTGTLYNIRVAVPKRTRQMQRKVWRSETDE